MKRTALIIGATGMVGSELLSQLLNHEHYEFVKIFVRRSTGIQHEKLKEFIVDFDHPEDWKTEMNADVLFSTMGTTMKTAGSKEVQYKIDFTYQFNAAKAAAENGVESYVLVSAQGANAQSKVFYSRMKGELDDAVQKLPFKKAFVMRPSILDGDRKENRPMEQIALKLMRKLAALGLLRKYKPIHAKVVAAAMINADLRFTDKYAIVDHLDMFKLAEK